MTLEACHVAIINLLSPGNYFETSCRYAGIAPPVGWEWLARGEGRDKDRPRTPVYAAFADALRAAESDVEVRMVAKWQTQMPEDWRAVAKFMERRYPDRWGRRERQEHVADGGGAG